MEGGVTPFASSMAPSGSYILIVVSQPMTEDHKKIILQRLEKGLLSWDVNSSGCDLSGLEYALSASIKDSVAESDVLIQHSTESLGVEVLLSPTVRTLKQCVKNLLSTQTSHKQLIHAGYTFAGSGSWILENGTFSFAEFLEIFQQADVQHHKRCILNVHCIEEGDWSKSKFAKDVFVKTADVSLNPPEKVNHVPGSEHLIRCLDSALIIQNLEEMMKPSPLVGNIRFNRPTIYMFPAGQGDCALFGINGFNMLIDGGFHRKPCSWDFVRHLDRLDAVLVTRIGESNISGVSTLMKRNALNNANPQIGYVFCNITENKSNPLKNGIAETKDDLIVSVVGEGHNFVQTLNDLSLKPHQCWRDSSVDPFVLYHKVGQGTLEMHVLSPPRDSKEMKLFLSEWNAYKETFSGVKSELKGVDSMIPLSHATSICAILVWRPEDPKDTITRILFPGSAPQYKILEGLEKLKVLNILNQPVVTKSSLKIPSSKVISNKIEKSVSKASIPNRNNTASPAHSISSVASRNGDIGAHKKEAIEVKRVAKEVKKEVRKEVKKEIKKDIVKEVKKESKTENSVKKDLVAKKEAAKDLKKDTKEVKKVVKKENKDLKSTNDKKEVKPAPKKESTAPTVKATSEVKKATTTVRKSTTPIKKDAGKPPIAPKTSDNKKAAPKPSEPKTVKDVSNKKTVESKTVSKAKPKTSTPKPSTTPKTKPVAVPKPGSKMTKAVAASSVVASAVAVTVAAVELNEKQEVIEDAEPEVSEKEMEIIDEAKEIVVNEKPGEIASPVPLEALSPTPSESVSLTPSDTLSSAPLETVSPTPPPLPNEPISTEEKDVNEIKDLEQDMPYEKEKVEEAAYDDLKTEDEINDIEAELEKHKIPDVMSASFIGENQLEDTVEEHFEKTEYKEFESAPLKIDSDKEETSEKDSVISESKDTEDEKLEENVIAEGGDIFKDQENMYQDTAQEKDVTEEKEVIEENTMEEKGIAEEKEVTDEKYVMQEMEIPDEKDFAEDNKMVEEKCSEEKVVQEEPDEQMNVGENVTDENKYLVEEIDVQKESVHDSYAFQEKNAAEGEGTSEEKFAAHEEDLDEEKYSAELRETGEKGVVEEKDDIKEKDAIEMLANDDEDSNKIMDEKINDIHYEEELKSDEENIKEIDEHLAGLSMEGSFCAGMMSSNEKDILSASGIQSVQTIDTKNAFDDQSLHDTENEYVCGTISKNESHFTSELSETVEIKKDECIRNEFSSDEKHKPTENYESHQKEQHKIMDSHELEVDQQQDIGTENDETHDDQFEKLNNKPHLEELSSNDFANNQHFENFSNIQSMESSFHQDMFGNYESTLDDPEMQETSVDEPEEINRKESVVSVTLNDESSDQLYMDNLRRKSGTESEDDVDIGKYMSKDHTVDEECLSVQRDFNSDGEDVMKSPTPHAVVEYEGHVDEGIAIVKQEIGSDEKQRYLNEKEDFDEKDRDSAEEHDTDDGEMIRHPTPPGMKYSEDEMRDPIGQHFITTPSLKSQVSDIADQPLYEEAEDSASERSVSPIIELPVYGNVVQADFPELVTVSGGTTPSEPQSPKSNFDAKKFTNDTAAMEALSEHDISDSSTHSPSCQDGSTAFDLQGSERSVIEVQSLRDEEVLKITDENEQNVTSSEHQQDSAAEMPSKIETEVYDDKDEKQEDKQETPSDEEESSSEDENSESHSKDKSDAMGDKSDVERDDRSDIHNDDRSDHHHDKSDVANDDDDDKSDIRDDEQLYRQQNKFSEHEVEDGYQEDFKANSEDNSEFHYNTSDVHFEKQLTYENQQENSPCIPEQFASEIDHELNMKNDSNFSESYHFENTNFAETEKNEDSAFVMNSDELTSSNVPSLPEMLNSNQDYQSSEAVGPSDMSKSEICAPEHYGSDFQYITSTSESVIDQNTVASDHEFKNVDNSSETEVEIKDKIEDNGSSHTFQTNDANFDYSQRDTNFHGFNTFAGENANEDATVECNTETVTSNLPGYPQDVPSGFSNLDNSDLYEKEENASLQYMENVTVSESKSFPEETQSSQSIHLSQYDESMLTSNEIYSDSGLIKDNIPHESKFEEHFLTTEETNVSEANYVHTDSQMQYTTTRGYEYTSVEPVDKFSEISGYEHDASYHETDIVNESCSKSSHFENLNKEDYKHLTESYSYSNEQYVQSETQCLESYTEKITTESTSENFVSDNASIDQIMPEIADINSNDSQKDIADKADFKMVNGKDEASSVLKSSGLTSEFYSSEITHQEIVTGDSQQIDQQSTYLINNRFHSDSPEDNTMRSDSSPDVPYPDLPDKFAEMKNSTLLETSSETYIHTTEDYKSNMNFSSTDAFPISTKSDSLNANQNNAYGESSEDESNSPVRGNVSPYAYTNKAYTREEEDVDGNHIYKEETTEVIKQVEFDGNNLQTLGTNQMGSVTNYSQDIQYSTGANYDFHLEEWGKPMGLPTPPDSSQKTVKKSEKLTVKSKTAVDANGKSPSVSSRLSSPLKKPKPKVAKESSSSPVYVDLAYVPQHADPEYCDVEFFKKIRARYYVISSVNPSKEVLNALLEAKKTWNEDLSVTIIPTYETDTLGYWMAQNQDDLAEYSIDVSPSASRCTVNLQDHQTSCSAYRLEF